LECDVIFTHLEIFLIEGCRNICERASSHISGIMKQIQCVLVLNSNHHRTQIIPVYNSHKILQSNHDKKDEEKHPRSIQEFKIYHKPNSHNKEMMVSI